MSEKRYSNCCWAPVLGELDSYTEDGHTYHIGRCSKCKDGAEFLTQEESDEEMNLPDAERFDIADRRRDELSELNKTFDEGMVMGGDKYNDTMFGAGDELEHEREDE